MAKAIGRKKSTAKKSVAALPARKKIGKKVYTKAVCSLNKTDAKKKAKSFRTAGKLARLVKSSTGKFCVFTASASKGIGKRKPRTVKKK